LTLGGFVGRDTSYLVKQTTPILPNIKMLKFLIDNIFAMFGGRVFQQTVGLPMGNKLLHFSPIRSFIRGGRLHTWASQEKRKEASPIP
jgi:hypothetical protein